MRDIRIRELNKEKDDDYIIRVVNIHIKAFPDFFLTQLGSGFLRILYEGYLEDTDSGLLVAEDERGILLGFIAYSNDYSRFYKALLKSHLLQFALCSMGAVIKHPSFTKRLLGAFKKSDEVKRKEEYVELASIGVDPEVEGNGIGSKLIEKLKGITDFNRYAYINLETDADDNEGANQFYLKNGFELNREYMTAQGRRMNEYHYYE